MSDGNTSGDDETEIVSTGYERDDDHELNSFKTGAVSDYDLPANWDSMSDESKIAWMTQERCRRQAQSQETAYAANVEENKPRLERRAEARNPTLGNTETVDTADSSETDDDDDPVGRDYT